MNTTTAIRLFLVFALISLTGFFTAGATAGATVPVLIGALGLLAAAASLTAAIDISTPRAS
jgi:hypothetical protein